MPLHGMFDHLKSNYQPVSLVCVCENLIKNHILNFIGNAINLNNYHFVNVKSAFSNILVIWVVDNFG